MRLDKKMSELWKDIPGWEERYQVSNLGNVRSLPRKVNDKRGYNRRAPGKLMKRNFTNSHGYPTVTLSDGQKKEHWLVHRLVMRTFVGPCPEGKEVAHNNGDRSDPSLSNLRYDTRAGNFADMRKHGTYRAGSDVPVSKLTDGDVIAIRENADRLTQQELASKYGVVFQTISNIQLGGTWKHLHLPNRKPVRRHARGERNGSAKLSASQVLEIIRLRGTDTISNIAARFKVSTALVGAIYAGRVWKHLQSQKEIG